jgi:hypothetical protein
MSNIATVVPTPTPPAAPSGLTATAALNPLRVLLSWTDNASNETGFDIQRATGATGVFSTLATVGANVTTFTDTSVLPNTTYRYQVRAVNTAGNSAFSNIATVPTPSIGLAIDATVWFDRNTVGNTITTPALTTTGPNELLLAFVSIDAPASGANNTVTGISNTGGGLTWVLVRRTNVRRGSAEIWRAFAPTARSITATARFSLNSNASSMTLIAFRGTDTTGANGAGAIGATGTGNGASGAPTASLTTTRANSWVWGVGNDWDRAAARTVGSGQTKVHEFLATVGDTYWVQRRNNTTPASGTTVTINDTAPINDRWNLSIVEVRTP